MVRVSQTKPWFSGVADRGNEDVIPATRRKHRDQYWRSLSFVSSLLAHTSFLL
jgi:hypothetical protein